MKRALFVAAVVFLASSPSPAQATSRFVEIPAGGWDPGPELRRQHEGSVVDWVRRVDVHPDALFDDSIEVDLFDLKVRLQRVAGHPPGEASDPVHVLAVQNGGASSEIIPSRLRWAGKTASSSSPCTDVEGTVRVSEGSDGRLQAIFDIGSFRYELRGGVLIRKDLRRLPREAPVRDVSPAVRGAAPTAEAGTGGKSTVRVLFGYGAAALGSDREEVFAEMRKAVCLANKGFLDSGIQVELERAGNVLPGYQETGVTQTLDDLMAGRRGTLGFMHQVRDAAKADIVLMIIDTGSSPLLCGQAQRLLATKEAAFAVVERNCLGATTSSLAHEMGHLFGADHEPANASISPPRFDHGHGYQAPENAPDRWRTVMSYECSGVPCRRVNLWSSPDLSHNGLPAGTEGTHHNARVLNDTRQMIADFYP